MTCMPLFLLLFSSAERTEMKVFYGPQRKLSLFSLALYVLGWVAFVTGFVRRMVKPTATVSRRDNYPEIVAVAVGPLFLLFAFLHACLNGTPSALMGSVAAVSAAVFLVCLGNTSITSAQVLYKYNGSDNATTLGLSLPYLSTSLAGSLLCCLAITMLLALWDYYWRLPRRTRRVNRRVQREIVLHNDDNDDDDDSVSSSSNTNRKAPLFAGCARKAALCCIIIAGLGWGILVGGHHQRISRIPREGGYVDNIFYFDFGQWTSIVLTPILLLFAIIHAGATGRSSSVMGVVIAILNGFVLISMGFYLIHDVGGWLEEQCSDGKNCNFTLPKSKAALCEIVGGFLFVFFWASVLGIWPFYTNYANVRPPAETRPSDQLVTPTGYSSSLRSMKKNDDDDLEPLEV